MITGKIDVKKIVKDKLYIGEKGTYLDFVLIETPNSEFSDFMICQRTKKDEDSIIIGNAEHFKKKEANQPEIPDSSSPEETNNNVDGLPF